MSALPRLAPIRAFSSVVLAMLVLTLAAPPLSVEAQQPGEFGPQVNVRAVPQQTQVEPGDQLSVAIVMEFGEGFHAWPDKPQIVMPPEFNGIFDASFAIPTEVTVQEGALPEGWSVWPTQYPEPVPQEVRYTGMPVDLLSFAGTSVIHVPVQVAPDAAVGPAEVGVEVAYQACDEEVCYSPETIVLRSPLDVVATGSSSSTSGGATANAALFQGFDFTTFGNASPVLGAGGVGICEPIAINFFGRSFPLSPCGPLGLTLLLLVAAIGGFLLNFTPCVLPVIPLKVMGLSRAAGDRGRLLLLGVAMSVGVVAFWLVLGGAIAFIAGFDAISSLFQTGWFSLVVGLFVGFMALGMFGLFAVKLPQSVYRLNPSHDTLHGSFLFGLLTAVLSTPCTAPFMGSAAAWAATQPSAITIGTFAMIGAGMALPYLVLSARPGLVSAVPRSGPASELVKQVMGLFMLAVATFFLGIPISAWLQEPPAPAGRGYWWVVAFFVVAAAAWLIVRTFQITRSTGHRAAFSALALVIAIPMVALTPGLSSHGPIAWTYYTPEGFEAARAQNQVVVMDFTAEWCLNCKALEAGVLHQPQIVDLLEEGDVVPMKVDLTGDNPVGKAKLKELEWVGIPLLAVFGPGVGYEDDTPHKYDSYTQDTVLRAVDEARGGPISSR